MPTFVFAYHGGKRFETREEGAAHKTKWNAWVEDLGEILIEPSRFFGQSNTVSAKGVAGDGGANPISGITILQVDTLEAALEIAKACPHINIGGTIEVAEAMQM